MSDGRKCTVCSKGGIFRKGSDVCLRCERTALASKRDIDAPAETEQHDDEPAVAVAVVQETTTTTAVAVATSDDMQLPTKRRKKKNYVYHMGRVMLLDEDD